MDVKLRLAVERVALYFRLLQISAIACLTKVLVELFQKLAVSKGRAFGRASQGAKPPNSFEEPRKKPPYTELAHRYEEER